MLSQKFHFNNNIPCPSLYKLLLKIIVELCFLFENQTYLFRLPCVRICHLGTESRWVMIRCSRCLYSCQKCVSTLLTTSFNIIQLCCSVSILCVFTEKGRIFMFGSNEWGQLGLGHTKTVTKPTRIKDKSRLK